MIRRLAYSAAMVCMVLAGAAHARQGGDPASTTPPPTKSPAETAAIAERLAGSLVRVEITPQYDKGESPGEDRLAAWRSYMMQMNDRGGEGGWEGWDQLVKEERPAERGGFVLAPNRVYTADPGLHPRFIKSIMVRFGEQAVPARPVAWPRVGEGLILETERPLAGVTPLSFDPTKAGPYQGLSYEKRDATWVTRIGGLRSGVAVTADGRKFVPQDAGLLVIDRDGNPVTITPGELPIDGAWKQAPSDWSVLDEAQMAAAIRSLEDAAGRQVVRCTLNFRSPRNTERGGMGRYGYPGGDREPDITEWNGLGVVVADDTVMVLANLKPKVTARLERIRLHPSSGEEVRGTFSGTLKDWGAMLVKLERPMPGIARLSSEPITSVRHKLLMMAEVTVRGETRTAHHRHARVKSFLTSWKGATFPMFDAGGSAGYYDQGAGYLKFLFGLDGELVALPLERREKVSTQERYGYGGDATYMVPVSLVSGVLGDSGGSIDSENRPLSEDEENRLAWLGVEMQGMDPDLARASDVMDETNGGMSGGIVTYLYPNSPAASAGLQDGDIILRLHVEGQPKPLEVSVDDPAGFGMMEQFWANLDRVPEEYFDRLPRPWGNAENALTRALTDLGFGTPFVADIWRDGKLVKVPMTVTQGPAHYDAAARWKSESLGLTVRDLTYEVRRYFQMKDDEPGVIISKLEAGSKAAVAGLKPFETIRTINDQPVTSVKDFERLASGGGELKLAVKRMTQGRTVKIKTDAKPDAPKADAAPAEDDAKQ